MSKVDCFEIDGLQCWFYSNDHDPPHFHVKRRGEWEMRVYFAEGEARMFELKWGNRPGTRLLRRLAELVAAHRIQLQAEWEAKVNR
ncbi:DUF4160 domain-containing protein [Paludisphaera rhizosphaerae]|uniref:DUF4160 domain-containing protein n=1 Tax=Paludisphaera rhizosphaerae TaxID=2711216 RepID=UPI0013EB053A|nr:DUF4160 domain-containing protein [Paludisphaera rhizosphaerae]